MSARWRWRALAGCAGLFLASGLFLTRDHYAPDRLPLDAFPREILGFTSQFVPVSNQALRILKLTDYLSRNYNRESDGRLINLYVGYYAKQRQGSVIHSPSHCLPANGWFIEERQRVPMPGHRDGALINRMVAGNGDQRQLVYYWYQGRGRIVDDEFMAVLYRAGDAMLRNRSDEALIRFATDGDDEEADRALREFIEQITPMLEPYVPA